MTRMYVTLQDEQPQDVYIYATDQKNLYVPTPATVYGSYARSLIGFLAFLFLALNQVVKVKKN